MRTVLALGPLVAAALAVAGIAAPRPAAAEPSRIVAISDVHGAYDRFVDLLRTAGVVGPDLAWAGGDAALVIVGDSLDRGGGSRRVLDLLMRLETEAPAAGGQVHVVLGNHEVMNLLGETEYVAVDDFAAYAADEPPGAREAAWRRFRERHADGGEDALAAEFARRYPPGFFGQRAAFGADGEIGAWLMRRPAAAVIGDTAFVHGGYPPEVDASAVEISATYAAALRDYFGAYGTLLSAGVLHPEDPFHDHVALAAAFIGGAAGRGSDAAAPVARAAERVVDLARGATLGGGGVDWYRGGVSCSPAVESDRVERALARLGAARIVVGHTPTPTARVLSRFGGKLIRIDTGMQQARGRASALVIRGGEIGALYAGDPRVVPIGPQPRRVGIAPPDGDDPLEEALARAAIIADTVRPDGTRALRLDVGGAQIDAVFEPIRNRENVPAVAAYRLDRLLELDLVPVTVLREVGGKKGVVYVDPTPLTDETQRVAARGGADAWCPLADQFGLMDVFHALAHEPGRSPEELRYRPQDWQLTLTGNRRLFGTDRQIPAYLRSASLQVSAALRARLAALDTATLEQHLGDVLDARRRAALLARVERVLRRAAD